MFLWAIDSLFIAHCFYLLFIVSLLICACCCGFCGNKRFLTACFYINAQWMSFTLYIWCSLIGVWCIFCIFVCYFSSFLIFSLSRLGREAVVFGIFVILWKFSDHKRYLNRFGFGWFRYFLYLCVLHSWRIICFVIFEVMTILFMEYL
jgi:hypothetical protein